MPATPPTASATALGLLDPAELEAVRRPFKAARLLPPRVFHDPEILDFATVTGLADLRRLRSDVPWAVASVRQYNDDGTPPEPDAPP